MAHYGIDLGTSNCLVAKVMQNIDDSFDVKCLSDDDGSESFPSIVYFVNEKQYRVGNSALNNLYEKPDSTVEHIKVRLGKTDRIEIRTGNTVFDKSPQEISSYILSHLNAIHNNQVRNAVITVPAFFDQSQKDATMQAGTIAEMTPKFLIEEPTAAIMYHIFSEYKEKGLDFFEGKQEKKILVFDFGGGTLDLSLIGTTLNDREVIPKVIAIGGDTELGGNIIDLIFMRVILTILKRNYNGDRFIEDVYKAFDGYYDSYLNHNKMWFADSVALDVKNFIFRLKRNLEQIKIKLSASDKETIVFEGQYKPFEITREQFEQHVLMSDELNIRDRIETALNQISKKRERISEVLLIGGSSQIPLIKDIIVETFEDMGITQKSITLSSDFEQAVAKGAAIQAAISDGVPIPPFMLNKCESIVARDIEIEHAGLSQLFVPMGIEYPFKKRKEFPLKIGHALSETVSLCLNEVISKNGQAEEKRQICNFEFYLPIYYTNDDITVYMNIDEAGLYQIEAIHNNTGEAVEFEPHKRFSLSSNEIKLAKLTAKTMVDVS